MRIKAQIANMLTCCRILCGAVLLFTPVFSACFNIVYLIGGMTDMLDGAFARKTGTESRLGARLDTFADLIFTAAAMIKILPVIDIPLWVWIWTAVIAAIRLGSMISGFIRSGRYTVEHTVMNKLTGIMLFLLPMTLCHIEIRYSAAAACCAASVSAIQEWYYVLKGKEIV